MGTVERNPGETGESALSTRLESPTLLNRAGHKGIDRELRSVIVLLRSSPVVLLGLFLVLVMVGTALACPLLTSYDPIKIDAKSRLAPPSRSHLFGTDNLGRDVLTRVAYGGRLSLLAGITIVSVASTTGSILGAVAGYVGGIVDEVIMRITDVFLALPYLVLAMAIAVALGPGITNAMIAISAVWWPTYARLLRGQALSVRQRPYVEAARSIGSSPIRILFRHIIPNCWDVVIVQASLDLGNAIIMAAALGFLGLGAQPPQPEWGAMISFARTYMRESWWMSLFPGLAILTTVIGFNLVGDGVREVLDPRRRRPV